MPNFPDSIYSPALKSAGQTISAAFFNDPDGELTAIETGYLNGTARLNSSNSTVANLSVTGGTTLASLDINGNSSLASSVTFGTIPYVFPSSGGSSGHILVCVSTSGSTMTLEWRSRPPIPPDAALVFLQSTGAVGSSAASTLSFLSQALVVNSSMHSTTTNPDRLTPQSTGLYQVAAQFTLAGAPGAASKFKLDLIDSSATAIASQSGKGWSEAGSLGVVGFKRFDVTGGWISVVFNNEGGGSTHSLSSGIGGTWFSMVKL